MIVTFRPIQNWPDGWQDPGRERLSAPFRSGYNETLKLLDDELYALGATEEDAEFLATLDRSIDP